MTPRSVKRARVLDQRRHSRWFRKNRRPQIRAFVDEDRLIRSMIQHQLDALDAAERRAAHQCLLDAGEYCDWGMVYAPCSVVAPGDGCVDPECNRYTGLCGCECHA